MFLLNKDDGLSLNVLGKIIQTFIQDDLPKMKRYHDYYKGKMAIAYKTASDTGRPCNKICVNFCRTAVNVFNGYITGNDITYTNDEDEDEFDAVYDVLNYNDVHQVDTLYLRNALIYGRAAELSYIDSDGITRFAQLDPREVIDVYDDTLEHNLLYAIRFYRAGFADEIQDKYYVEVYDDKSCRKYSSAPGFASFNLISEEPHYFGQVPMTFFYLDEEGDSIFDQIMSLNDAYNDMLSGGVDAFDDFSDAYLVLKGAIANAEDLEAMKAHRTLMLDTDASAEFLTKNITDTQLQTTLTDIERLIHVIGSFPDFNAQDFSAQSGVALKYKLIGFTNIAKSIEAYMKKALQRRIELIAAILNLKGEETVWRDVKIEFHYNIPEDTASVAQVINLLRGLVSNETLLSQLEFVENPAEEAEKARNEAAANMNIYAYGNTELLDEEKA